MRKTTQKEVENIFSQFGYEVIGDYVNNRTPLEVKCPNGHVTSTITYGNFKRGQRCSQCSESKGERVIRKYLDSNNINYIYDQPYFIDLLSDKGNPLRPDFILPKEKVWIEYDGEFHFKKMYESDGHDLIKAHDKIKDEYAKKNGYNMIRIPYWDFDRIEEILIEVLK